MIYNIQRFSIHDGAGIRTVIFFKGCTLYCQWCSNPESQSFDPEIMFDPGLCRKFGDCLNVDSSIRLQDDRLILNRLAMKAENYRDVCVTRAITVVGEEFNIEKILTEIEKDRVFYDGSNGGVTLSGGEPLAQGEGLIALLQELKKRNIDVAAETTLHVMWPEIERTTGLIKTYLVDLKHTDSIKFKEFTAGNLDQIIANLQKLNETGSEIIIRIPVIPRFNHTNKEIYGIIDFIQTLSGVKEIQFIPFHNLGKKKYTMLDKTYMFSGDKAVSNNELSEYQNYAESKGYRTRIGG